MNLIIPEPNDKQKLFLKSTYKHTAYGGARGGGKSWAVRTKAVLLAARYPGIKMLIVRRTYPELLRNHIEILRRETLGLAKYNGSEKMLKFLNGSTIEFMYCDRDSHLDRLQGAEYDCIFIDEATQLSEKQMRAIAVCCRGVNGLPKRVYYTCNPGGQGHAYFKRLFIDRKFLDNEKPEDYTFIQALVDDNSALMEAQPEYVDELMALPEKLREAWRYGRWDVFEGQVFTEFRDDPEHYQDRLWTHVIEPFEIPETWTIIRGFDWGYAKPFSAGWYAVSHDGVLYRIRELYGSGGGADVGVEWTVDEVAEKMREVEETDVLLKDRRIRTGVADPAIFAADGGESIAETMERHRIYFDRGDNQRLPGKMQCHYRLAFDDNGRPMFQVFNTCKHFIRTIPTLIYSETQVEDVDTHMEDHAYDEWRYVCMSRPISPRPNHKVYKPIPGTIDDPLNMIEIDDRDKPYDYVKLF